MTEQPELITASNEVLFDVHGYPMKLPKSLNARIKRNGINYLPGVGVAPSDIMFVQGYVFDEQAEDEIRAGYQTIKTEPRVNKGGAFNTLKDLLGTLGISIDLFYYTSFIKFRPPKGRHNKPPAHVVEAMTTLFAEEVERVQPKIIVTFGKLAFEQITGKRVRFDQIRACWFNCERYNCLVFAMPDALQPVLNPGLCEQLRVDLCDLVYVYEGNKLSGDTDAWSVRKEELNYSVIHNSSELKAWVDERLAENCRLLSVDCEFGGRTIVDCKLRSLQACWKPSWAVYIRFMDDKGNYAFDVDYKEAGKILAPLCDHPEMKYIGYSAAIDVSRMSWFLGLEWYNKIAMDIQYGIQAFDEDAEQGLERVALQYTRFGRYDSDLMDWKTANPGMVTEDTGYLYVPDEILVSYACIDVDVPMRAYGKVILRLIEDDTYNFYNEYANVLVGNIFITFMLTGLPVKVEKLESLRNLYDWGKTELEKEFLKRYAKAIEDRLEVVMMENASSPGEGMMTFLKILSAKNAVDTYSAFNEVMGKNADKYRVVLEAYHARDNFKLRSADHKVRWLFDVMGYIPVKSTANKSKGQYSTPWERVLELPKEAQKQYSPAVDKQVLTILANDTGDELINFALQVIAVGSIRNSVLKPAELDDNGEVVKENGLMYWLASDGRIHCNFAATETWRPRAWKPNTLNWSSYVHDGVKKALKELLKIHATAGTLPLEFKDFESGEVDIPSIRSVIDISELPPSPGSEGWIFVESDYDAAELCGQAFQSGDENFILLITEPDDQFGLVKDNAKARVRLRYSETSGIPIENQRPEFLMTWTEGNKLVAKYTIESLLVDSSGALIHPRHDLHWGLAEYVQANPRELYVDKFTRTGIGKLGNFSVAYGTSPTTLERKYKSDTGKEPEPGTGQKIIDALTAQRPVAMQWLNDLEKTPVDPGYIQSESGAKRHFKLHAPHLRGISSKTKKSVLASLAREARNFHLQHSVGATAIRAEDKMMEHCRQNQIKHVYPVAVLYDSLVTMCPIEMRFEVQDMHQRFMCDENQWHNHGRTWNYTATHEMNFAWSERPSKEQQKLLSDRNYKTTFSK